MVTPSPTLRIVIERKRLYRRLHQLIHFSFYKEKKNQNKSSKDDTTSQDYTGNNIMCNDEYALISQ